MIDKIAQPREQDEMFLWYASWLVMLRQEDEIQADVCYHKWLAHSGWIMFINTQTHMLNRCATTNSNGTFNGPAGIHVKLVLMG